MNKYFSLNLKDGREFKYPPILVGKIYHYPCKFYPPPTLLPGHT